MLFDGSAAADRAGLGLPPAAADPAAATSLTEMMAKITRQLPGRLMLFAAARTPRRPGETDPFLPKVEELVERSTGTTGADVVHQA